MLQFEGKTYDFDNAKFVALQAILTNDELAKLLKGHVVKNENATYYEQYNTAVMADVVAQKTVSEYLATAAEQAEDGKALNALKTRIDERAKAMKTTRTTLDASASSFVSKLAGKDLKVFVNMSDNAKIGKSPKSTNGERVARTANAAKIAAGAIVKTTSHAKWNADFTLAPMRMDAAIELAFASLVEKKWNGVDKSQQSGVAHSQTHMERYGFEFVVA